MEKIEIIEKYVQGQLDLSNKVLKENEETEKDKHLKSELETVNFILELILETIQNVKKL